MRPSAALFPPPFTGEVPSVARRRGRSWKQNGSRLPVWLVGEIIMARNGAGWVCSILLAAMSGMLSAHAADMETVEKLPVVQTAPERLLCTAPKELGMQFIACDAFKKFGEPVSPVTALGSTNLAIRVTYIPSFSPWSVMRIEFAPRLTESGEAVGLRAMLTVETTKGSGRKYARSVELSWEEMWLILQSVNLPDVFTLPNTNESTKMSCLDGIDYVIELAEQSRYHWVLLGCNDPDDPRKSLNPLVHMLGVIARAHDSEGLKDFPGH